MDLSKWKTTRWNKPNWQKFVYPKDSILYLNRKKSGDDYVSLMSIERFGDVIIYYERFIWGRNSVKLTTHKEEPAPIAAWQPFPMKGEQAKDGYNQA